MYSQTSGFNFLQPYHVSFESKGANNKSASMLRLEEIKTFITRDR